MSGQPWADTSRGTHTESPGGSLGYSSATLYQTEVACGCSLLPSFLFTSLEAANTTCPSRVKFQVPRLLSSQLAWDAGCPLTPGQAPAPLQILCGAERHDEVSGGSGEERPAGQG